MDTEATTDNDPCTSRSGKPKERWPNAEAAWFVVELVAAGKHRTRGRRGKMYAYLCPKCDGWHLAKCRNAKDRKRHRRGIEELHRRLEKKKKPQLARKKLRNEEEGLTDSRTEV